MKALRFLLLEDSLLDTELIQAQLIDGGIDCELVRVETRPDFLTALENDSFDLILSDYSLPAFDGIAALEIAHAKIPEVPFIFVSATLGEELAIETLKKGATDYVLKQRLERLVPAVKRALREAEERIARQQAEQELQNALQQLAFHVENSPLAVVEWNQDFRVSRWSQQAEKIFGWSAEEVLGKHPDEWQFIHIDDLQTVRNTISQLCHGRQQRNVSPNRNYTKDGSVIHCEWYNSALLDESGNLISVLSLVLDITDRKQAETALRESQELFQNFMRNTPTAAYMKDAAGHYIYLNPVVERVFRRQLVDLVGKSDFDLFPVQTAQQVRNNDIEVLKAGKPLKILETIQLEGVEQHWMSYKFPFKDASGRQLIAGMSIDVTEQKRAEEQLYRREQEFRALAENSPDIIARIDQDMRFIYINPAIERATGIASPNFIGKTSAELGFSEKGYASWEARVRDSFTTGQECSCEFYFPSPDQTRYYQSRLVPEFALDGSVEFVLSITRDVTDYKQVEQALRKSEAKFRRVVESKMIGMGFWDENLNVIEVNDAYLELVGYSQEDILRGRVRWQDITPPEYLEMEEQKYQETLQTGICPPYEKEYIRKDGSRIPVLIGGACFGDRCDGGVFFALDLTERKELENQLRQQAEELTSANRVKDEFLAVLSHELRSPLNPILGWARLLRTRKLDEAATARAMETIERNARLQTQLIDDLLDVSRIIQGKLSLNFSPINLVATVDAALETVRLSAEAKSIEIECLRDPTVGLVAGDPNRLQQVVWNLLSNAIKFTPPGGRVTVYIERDQAFVQIRVSDTGKGINPEFLPYVFDYFRQADSSTTRKHGGLGLGLAIVHHLVQLHGGTVRADSPGENLGATFSVQLPILPVKPSTNEGNTGFEQSLDLKGVRILVVDDDADTREFLTFMLEQYGAEAMSAESAAEALEVIRRVKPAVLVSDIGMPEEDGYSLIRKVRAMESSQGGQTLAVALTAYARDEDRTKALLAGFQQHVSKPVSPAELVTVVASLVGRIDQSQPTV